jgi:RNA recognition motif-containing protein
MGSLSRAAAGSGILNLKGVCLVRLYVANLDFSIGSRELKELFEAHGSVTDCQIILKKGSGRSRGFGFITMPNQEEAMKTMVSMNGQPFKGRSLVVNEAHPRSEFGQVLSKARETAGERRTTE